MKAKHNGSTFTVWVTEQEVRDFMDTWPCSGLSGEGGSFTFATRNGDLVDHTFGDVEDGYALAALSEDAQEYGKSVLGLEE
jgi:hypothetical protein